MFLALAGATCAAGAEPWPEKGTYRFAGWGGPALEVHYSVPPGAQSDAKVLVVIPGARRNADVYRDAWHGLAVANGFVVLSVGASADDFPTEYDYNAGGVVTPEGLARPASEWLYSAIEPLFDDFRARYGSTAERYALYGHSAGGQFVHAYLLFKPDARVSRAVAANPAFFMMPLSERAYPFGPAGAPVDAASLKEWLRSPLVLVLGDRDIGPRTRKLSSGPLACEQGPNVLSRGLRFYHEALVLAETQGAPLAWRLDVLHGIGHSNEDVAPHALRHLFPD